MVNKLTHKWKEIQYNLRPNAERARIAAENRLIIDVTHSDDTNNINPPENSNTCEIKHSIFTMERAVAVVTQTARFCGHLESSNPQKRRLEQYNIYRWLADVETRTAPVKIQTEN